MNIIFVCMQLVYILFVTCQKQLLRAFVKGVSVAVRVGIALISEGLADCSSKCLCVGVCIGEGWRGLMLKLAEG